MQAFTHMMKRFARVCEKLNMFSINVGDLLLVCAAKLSPHYHVEIYVQGKTIPTDKGVYFSNHDVAHPLT